MLSAVLFLVPTAWASTRLVITTDEVVTIDVGGVMMSPSHGGLRHSAVHPGGAVPLRVLDARAVTIYQADLELTDHADLHGQWSRLGGLVLEGQAVTPSIQDSDVAIAPPEPAEQPDLTASGIDTSGDGSRAPSSPTSTRSSTQFPDLSRFTNNQQPTETAEEPTTPNLQTQVLSGAMNMVRGAESGTSFGSGAPQGFVPQRNPYAPPPVTGSVMIQNPSGVASLVYFEGMFLGEFKAGDLGPLKKEVGVGVATLQFLDPATGASLVTGAVKIEEDIQNELGFSGTTVQSHNRPWTWSPD